MSDPMTAHARLRELVTKWRACARDAERVQEHLAVQGKSGKAMAAGVAVVEREAFVADLDALLASLPAERPAEEWQRLERMIHVAVGALADIGSNADMTREQQRAKAKRVYRELQAIETAPPGDPT